MEKYLIEQWKIDAMIFLGIVMFGIIMFLLARLYAFDKQDKREEDFLQPGGSSNTVDSFKRGDSVVYVSKHQQSNKTLEDCQPGRVKRTSETFVFVEFWDNFLERYSETAQAVDPRDLWHRI